MSNWLDAIALRPDGEAYVGEITAQWAQGRSAFGGLLAGMAVVAARTRLPVDRRLVSVLVDFPAPALLGAVRVEVRVTRSGRAITHVEARVSQGAELCAVVLLVFAAHRETGISWPGAAPAEAPGPEQSRAFGYVEGVFPAFTQNFQYRWTSQAYPFTGADVAAIDGWVRLVAPVPIDEAVILALVDAWPAPALPLMHGPAPASTVTWMVDLFGSLDVPADGWWRFASETVAAGSGYASFGARLWAPGPQGGAGRLVAVSRQMVAEFSKPRS